MSTEAHEAPRKAVMTNQSPLITSLRAVDAEKPRARLVTDFESAAIELAEAQLIEQRHIALLYETQIEVARDRLASVQRCIAGTEAKLAAHRGNV